jgi:hypothetical protein
MKKYSMARTGDTWNVSQLRNASSSTPNDFRAALSPGDSELESLGTVSVPSASGESSNSTSPWLALWQIPSKGARWLQFVDCCCSEQGSIAIGVPM